MRRVSGGARRESNLAFASLTAGMIVLLAAQTGLAETARTAPAPAAPPAPAAQSSSPAAPSPAPSSATSAPAPSAAAPAKNGAPSATTAEATGRIAPAPGGNLSKFEARRVRHACQERANDKTLKGKEREDFLLGCIFGRSSQRRAVRRECRKEGVAKGLEKAALHDYIHQCAEAYYAVQKPAE
jgi:hypothetical protein